MAQPWPLGQLTSFHPPGQMGRGVTWRKNSEGEKRGEGEGAEGPAAPASQRAGTDLVTIVPAEGTLAMPGTQRLTAQAKGWRERQRDQEPILELSSNSIL